MKTIFAIKNAVRMDEYAGGNEPLHMLHRHIVLMQQKEGAPWAEPLQNLHFYSQDARDPNAPLIAVVKNSMINGETFSRRYLLTSCKEGDERSIKALWVQLLSNANAVDKAKVTYKAGDVSCRSGLAYIMNCAGLPHGMEEAKNVWGIKEKFKDVAALDGLAEELAHKTIEQLDDEIARMPEILLLRGKQSNQRGQSANRASSPLDPRYQF